VLLAPSRGTAVPSAAIVPAVTPAPKKLRREIPDESDM
jgi:hypothetical protein